MYAIIETGGKQYRVQEGDVINVEKLAVNEGQTLNIDKVLLVEKDGAISVGTPVVEERLLSSRLLNTAKAIKSSLSVISLKSMYV